MRASQAHLHHHCRAARLGAEGHRPVSPGSGRKPWTSGRGLAPNLCHSRVSCLPRRGDSYLQRVTTYGIKWSRLGYNEFIIEAS